MISRLLIAAFLFNAFGALAAQAQWQQTPGPSGGPIGAFSVRPSNGHVFALAGQSIYRSTDGGATWQPLLLNGIAGDASLNAVTAGSTTIYVAGNTPASPVAIFRSIDDGDTWVQALGSGLPFGVVNTFYLSGTTILAGLSSGSVYVSTDAGEHWVASNTGFAANVSVGWIVSFGTDLYAGSALASTTKGIYRSVDGGATWTPTNAAPTVFATSSLIGLTSNSSGVFAATNTAGVFKTSDNGATWPKISPGGLTNFTTAIVASSTDLFIGISTSIYRADATGAGWGAINTGLPTANAGTVVTTLVAPTGAALAGTNKWGVYRSTDAATWAPANTGMLAHKINGLHISGGYLYAAADGRGFFRSPDHGTTWTEINSGIAAYPGWYGFARTAAGTLLGGNGNGMLFRSTDHGATWGPSNTGLDLTGTFVLWPDGGTIYAGGYHSVSSSVDDGASWTPLPTGFTVSQTVLDVWKKGPVMLAGANAGIKRSIDSGTSWTAPLSGLPLVSAAYSAFTQVGTELFFGTAFGVHRSQDDGATWAPRSTGLDGAVAALYANGEDLYAGTNKGVYHSTDRGGNWTAINDGFPINFPIYKLTGDGSYLIAGGTRHSVWRRPLVTTAVGEQGFQRGIELSQNTPNPLHGGTTITFSIPRSVNVSVDVFDISGAHVARLVEGTLAAGPHTVAWDRRTVRGEQALPGVYVYQLTAAGERVARKMVVTR